MSSKPPQRDPEYFYSPEDQVSWHIWDPNRWWAPYVPSRQTPWNLRRVVHLHRRAGVAATWNELQRDLKEGPGPSVQRLLEGKARSEAVPEAFASLADALRLSALQSGDPARLKGWWVYRMLWGPDPLGERLTLLWHNHFATSIEKIRSLTVMHRQNELFRRYGRGPFGKLLREVVHDPALLIWLDAHINRKGDPNENLARELMELFTLGVGQYTEKDVREAACALTGWMVIDDKFHESAFGHDDGIKTILGRTGRWHGDDLVDILLGGPEGQPPVLAAMTATSRRLAWRLCEWLMGENAVDSEALDRLASGLRKHDFNIGWAVGTVLRSEAFFSEKNLSRQVLGPVEFVVGAVRALECVAPPPSTTVLAEWAAHLGQDLFCPPNVGGWTGGRAWLSSAGIVGRANYAAALVEGQLASRVVPLDGLALARRHNRGRDIEDIVSFCKELLTGSVPGDAWRTQLLKALGPKPRLEPDVVRAAIALVLASPEVQVC